MRLTGEDGMSASSLWPRAVLPTRQAGPVVVRQAARHHAHECGLSGCDGHVREASYGRESPESGGLSPPGCGCSSE